MRILLVSLLFLPQILRAHPIADFSSSTEVVCPGDEVQFFDESHPPSAIAFWSWDFNGGEANSNSIPNPTVTFDSSGVYTVSLTVVDTHGHADTETKQACIFVDSVPRLGIDTSMVPPDRRWKDSTCLDLWEDSAHCREFWIIPYDPGVSVSGDGLVEGGDYFCPDSAGLGEAWITFSATSNEGCSVDTSFKTYVGRCEDDPSAIEAYPEKDPPELYYDPFTKTIELSREVAQARLYDMQGRLLREGTHARSLNVPGLSRGIYLLRGPGWGKKVRIDPAP